MVSAAAASRALLNKEFAAKRWTLRRELKLTKRPGTTLHYFRRAVAAAPIRLPTLSARDVVACVAAVAFAAAVRAALHGALGDAWRRRSALGVARLSYCLWWFVCGDRVSMRTIRPRRRRGRDVESPSRRVAATPGPRRG